jgi:hypothetical protein
MNGDKSLDLDRFKKEIGFDDLENQEVGDFQFVQEMVLKSTNCFWQPIDFPSRSPDRVQKALSKLVSENELKRIIRGLYWRGEKNEQDEIIDPKVINIVKKIIELDFGVGYTEETAFKRLGLHGLNSKEDGDIYVAVPKRSPRTVPGAKIISRTGATLRYLEELNWLEVSFLEVLINWHNLKSSKHNQERLLELISGFKGSRADYEGLSLRQEKLVLASRTEKAIVRDSLINLFNESGQTDYSENILPVRKRNYSPGIKF